MRTRRRCSFCSGTQVFHRPGQELGLLSPGVVGEANDIPSTLSLQRSCRKEMGPEMYGAEGD